MTQASILRFTLPEYSRAVVDLNLKVVESIGTREDSVLGGNSSIIVEEEAWRLNF